MSLALIQSLVTDAVRDKDGVVSPTTLDQAIAEAVQRYSVDRPRRVVGDVTAPGGDTLPVPAGWVADFSELLGVEYPTGENPPSELDSGMFAVYHTPTGDEVRLAFGIDAGDTVRLDYIAQHTLDNTTDTIPSQHRFAVAALAASILCGQLAAYYATEGAPTIPADITDHQGKTERFRARAKDLLAEYNRIVVVPDRATTPRAASATKELASRDSFGAQRLFHPPRSVRP